MGHLKTRRLSLQVALNSFDLELDLSGVAQVGQVGFTLASKLQLERKNPAKVALRVCLLGHLHSIVEMSTVDSVRQSKSQHSHPSTHIARS